MKKTNWALPATLLLACAGQNRLSSTVTQDPRRSRDLALFAAAEAGHIPDADARLTQQLNIAEEVLVRFRKEDAVTVLLEASRSLRSVGGSLNEQARLAGWISVAQLAQRAENTPAAVDATTAAVKELQGLANEGDRCQYVMAVAEELNEIEGKTAAADMLVNGGRWAAGIASIDERRAARLSFAAALFNLDAYEAGVATLREEKDPVWSARNLLQFAGLDSAYVPERAAAVSFAAPAAPAPQAQVETSIRDEPPPAKAVSIPRYGKSLSYEQVFRGRSTSSTH